MPIIDGFLTIRRCVVTKSVSGEPLDPPGLNRDCFATKITFSSLPTLFAILRIYSNSFLSEISVIEMKEWILPPLFCQYQTACVRRSNLFLFIYFPKFLFEVIRQISKISPEICIQQALFYLLSSSPTKGIERIEKKLMVIIFYSLEI